MPSKSSTKKCFRCGETFPRSEFREIPRSDSATYRLDPYCHDCRVQVDEERSPLPENTTVQCACGCGGLTNVAPVTDEARGWVKGEPFKFLKGHGTRHSPYPDALYTVDLETGCWNWNLSRDKDGYGHLHRGGKRLLAHRFFYEQRFGPLPIGMVPDHICPAGPNPSCVNPDHMRALTHAENSRWKSSTKLDWESVAAIRLLASQGVSQYVIADRFGVGQQTISRIVSGKSWAPKEAA